MAEPTERELLDRIRGLPEQTSLPLTPAAPRVAFPGGPATATSKRAVDAAYAYKPVRGGRQTQPSNFNPFGLTGWYFIPRRQYQNIDVSEIDVGDFTAEQLLALLVDLNPDYSKALWNLLRFCGTELSFTALTLDQQESPQAQAVLDDIVDGINANWGGMDAVIRQLIMCAYIQGACTVDVAPSQNLKDVEDIYVVNPDSIYFERDSNQRLVPFQRQMIWGPTLGLGPGTNVGGPGLPFRLLNEETFMYVPVDPFVDDPYGRPPVAPILQCVFQLAQVLRDLGKVVHHQGWPRLDFELVYEKLEPSIPEIVKADPNQLNQWLDARVMDAVNAYNSIAPEDAFVHMDSLVVHGDRATTASKLFDVAAVVHLFRQQLIEACKSLSIFHSGSGEKGETETWGSVQMEIYAASASVLREIAAEVLERALTVSLQLRGVLGLVRHEWATLRTTDRLKDAQAEHLEIANASDKRDQGWVTQDDASQEVTGSDAVAPEPAFTPLSPLTKEAEVPLSPDDTGLELPDTATAIESGRGMAFAYARAAMQRQLAGLGSNGRRH